MPVLPWMLLLLLGLTFGSFGTLIGAGGGFLLVPLLLYLYPTDSPAILTNISLVLVALNTLSGTAAYARAGRIDYRIGTALSAASVPGTMAGAALTGFLPRGLFETAFGSVLLLLGLFLFWKPVGQEDASLGAPGTLVAAPPGRIRRGVTASAVIGCLSGIMGIGGSPLQVAVLTHTMRVPVHTAMPTAQFIVLLSALGGVAAHVAQGHFDTDLTRLGILGVGVLLGAQLGAALSARITSQGLVRLLGLAVLTVSLRLILRAI
jgi:uncharacterized protein